MFNGVELYINFTVEVLLCILLGFSAQRSPVFGRITILASCAKLIKIVCQGNTFVTYAGFNFIKDYRSGHCAALSVKRAHPL